jgi:hypothetical protein
MMNGTIDPRLIALLSAGGGMMAGSQGMPGGPTPSFGAAMGNGIQSGLQGYMMGQASQQNAQDMAIRESQLKSSQNEAMKKLQMQEYLQQVVAKHGGNPAGLAKALMASPYPEIMKLGFDAAKANSVKSYLKGKDDKGNATYYAGTNLGELMPTGVSPAEKLNFQNLGGVTAGMDPYTGQPVTQMQNSMAPGESARLAQAQSQFAQSHMLDQARTANQIQQGQRERTQPKFQDGYWVTPPTAENPQGVIIPTDLAVAPKNSPQASRVSAAKVGSLLDEASKYVGESTGSYGGALIDQALRVGGVSTKGAENIAKLKTIEAGLVMGMPRLEGPQSNLDQQLYREAAGQIGDPTVPKGTKKAALKTIRDIQGRYPDAFGELQNHTPSGAQADGWGELK